MSEADLFRLLDRWWEQRKRREATEQLTGTVYGVPDTSRNLLVTLATGQQPVPVHRPASPTPYTEGDRVAITRGPDGFLLAGPPLDRDPTAPIVPGSNDDDEDGDPTAHTLGLHTALGLLDVSALADHADLPTHLHTYYTPNTGSADEGEWALMGSGSIGAKFGQVTIDAVLSGGGSMAVDRTRGLLRVTAVQTANFGTDPTVSIEVFGALGITGADVSLVVIGNSGPSDVELHVRVSREYEYLSLTPLRTYNQRASWTWTGCSDFSASLPAGTVYNGSELPSISPAQLVANTDNWNPTGMASAKAIRVSTDASRNLTGIVASGDGRRILLRNIGTQNLVLKHDLTSTAANRFYCPGAVDFTLNAKDSVWVGYDVTSARWYVEAS